MRKRQENKLGTYPSNRGYHPIQPHPNADVAYREIIPSVSLQAVICCYWELVCTASIPYSYRIVSDACMDILWEAHSPEKAMIAGLAPSCSKASLQGPFRYVGIRFFPSVVPYLFSLNAGEFVDKFEGFESVAPSVAREISQVSEPQYALEEMKVRWEQVFLKRLLGIPAEPDPRMWRAIQEIIQHQGQLAVEQDLDIGLSPRQLRRLFQQYIGCSPKTFAQIIRFQHVLGMKPSKSDLRTEKWYYDLGYYDQAHFVKEFKRFYGLSPTQAFP